MTRPLILARLSLAAAILSLASGCLAQTERERFGYSTADLIGKGRLMPPGDKRDRCIALEEKYDAAVRAGDAVAMRAALDALARELGVVK